MQRFTKIDRLSTWRRLALHTWAHPSDPSVYGTLEIDATDALAFIRRLREQSEVKVTITHLVGRAVALAIRERPEVNSIVRLGGLYRRETVDVFFQVAFEGGENLAGHKVDRADEKPILAMARELTAGASVVRRREGSAVRATSKISRMPGVLMGRLLRATAFATYDLGLDLSRFGIPSDSFGSAMVTNVGSFGLSSGHAPLVPFSRCPILLLVGEIQQRAVVRDGAIVAAPILTVGVTFDHRILDGYQAGLLAKRFRAVIEAPSRELAGEGAG